MRLPFLFSGFGSEEDAWGHVLNAFEMSEQNRYILSRLPGHPLYEALCLVLLKSVGAIDWVWNLCSALAISWAVVEFYRILEHFSIRPAFVLAMGFGALPVVWISGTTSMDYGFSLLAILWAYRLWLEEKWLGSAVVFGLSAGFRIVNPALAPILWIIALAGRKSTSKAIVARHSAWVLGLSALCFLPAFWMYGSGFFDFYRLPLPPLSKIAYKAGPGVWGLLGGLSILLALGVRLRSLKQPTQTQTLWLFASLVYALPYIRMPEKSAFFLPVIPFFLLWLSSGLGFGWNRFLGWSMCASALVLGIHSSEPHRGIPRLPAARELSISGQSIAFVPWLGAVPGEWLKRRERARYVDGLIEKLSLETRTGLLIAGWWYAEIEVERRLSQKEVFALRPVYYLEALEFERALQSEAFIGHLPGQCAVNDRKYQNSLCSKHSISYP